jgi:hypothetical protein
MGRSYLYECPKCSYRTHVSGGADHGQRFHVQTVLCRDCRKLHDAVIRVKVPRTIESRRTFGSSPGAPRNAKALAAPPFDEVLNRLALSGAKSLKWLHFKPRCPVSAIHNVQVWNDPGRCPRCGTYLEKSALPFRIWD